MRRRKSQLAQLRQLPRRFKHRRQHKTLPAPYPELVLPRRLDAVQERQDSLRGLLCFQVSSAREWV
jgi:hypothetical protein